MPIEDFLSANSSSGQAPAALTIGVGADGKVLNPPPLRLLQLLHALVSACACCREAAQLEAGHACSTGICCSRCAEATCGLLALGASKAL